jgi:putative transposase
MINRKDRLPLTRQCKILNLSRSGVYYSPVSVSDKDQELMKIIDKIHLEEPYWGTRGIKNELLNRGHTIGRSLMRKMGIEALYQKRRLSKPHPGHTVYPYMLKGMTITKANTVWCSDVTYIPMARGFCYLVAIMDWASRKVLSWRLSNTLDPSFCIDALEEAIRLYGTPQIFNTDQGSQFTREGFIAVLKEKSIKIRMDGRGRWMDKLFIERLWKSVKYQDIYLKAYASISVVRKGLRVWFDRYNSWQRHQGLDNQTPDEVYWGTPARVKDAV